MPGDTLAVLNTMLLTLMTVGAGIVARQLADIRRQTTLTNSRVTVLETWRTGHEQWVKANHDENQQAHGQLSEDIRVTRTSVHDLRNEAFKLTLREAARIRGGGRSED